MPKEDSNVDEHGTITDGYGKNICPAFPINLVSDGSLREYGKQRGETKGR